MNLKKQVTVQLEAQLPPRRAKNDGYLRVQEALKNVKGSMSQFSIDEREDRV